MNGTGHNLNADTLKAALYLATASISNQTTAYSSTGEVTGTNYTAGGASVTGAAASSSGSVAYWTPGAAISWTTVTLSSSFDCCLIYNTTHSNHAIVAITFTGQTVAAANFTINMPTNDSTHALVQLN